MNVQCSAYYNIGSCHSKIWMFVKQTSQMYNQQKIVAQKHSVRLLKIGMINFLDALSK